MNVLVTGSTGFVGSCLVKKLSKRHRVFALVRKKKDSKKVKSLGAHPIIGDILDNNSLRGACKNIDAIYHLAGLVSDWGAFESFMSVNYQGTLNLVKAAESSGVRQFVFMSTLNVLGMEGQESNEDSPYHPSSSYYVNAKIMAEKAIIHFAHDHSIKFTIIRACRLYGPGDNTYLPEFIRLLKLGKMVMIDKGKKLNSFLYVDDVVEALAKVCGNRRCYNQIIHTSSQEKTTNAQFLEFLAKELSVNPPAKSLPYWFALVLGFLFEKFYRLIGSPKPPLITPFRVKLVGRDHYYSTEKARRLIGFKQKVTLMKGIRKSCDYYKNAGII